MQSETECGNGSNDWAAALHTFGLMKHYFENGANAYMYWNMVLKETGKSQWGWKQNSMISINSADKSVKYNLEFYLMKHFSYFIHPGAYKLNIEGKNENCLAFKNENSIIIVYYNAGEGKYVSFKIDNQSIKVKFEKESFNTMKLEI
jgi:glucosylceramidase